MSDIYCVKIRQKRLKKHTKLDYFPFDRFYVFRKSDLSLARKLFRYSFTIDVNPMVLDAINSIPIDKCRSIPVNRNDEISKYEDTHGQINFFNILEKDMNPKDWMLVVPTHIRTRKETNNGSPETLLVQYVGYVLSNILTHKGYNNREALPAVQLNTPKKTLPLMCIYCTKITDFYAGECAPGLKSCRENADIIVENDDYYKKE